MGLKLEAALVETLEPKREKSTSKALQMILNLLLGNYYEYQLIVKHPI